MSRLYSVRFLGLSALIVVIAGGLAYWFFGRGEPVFTIQIGRAHV